jgi:hypothetical protein
VWCAHPVQAVASAYREEWPLLVVCPASLRTNWQCELARWLPPDWQSKRTNPAPPRVLWWLWWLWWLWRRRP